MATTSQNYVIGENDLGLPHYLVELDEYHLKEFEQFSSMCSLDEYEQLLYTLENKFLHKTVPVPPSDGIIIMLTLATASPHYKDQFIKANDPYNVGRADITKRCMRLLLQLVRLVESFDSEKYNVYDLELLRCQLFLVLDHINPKRLLVPISKRVRTHHGNKLSSIPFSDGEMSLDNTSNLRTNYTYISVLETKTTVFQNPLITHVLSQNGGFWNFVGWALSSEIDEDLVKNYCGETWLPIVSFLFSLYDLRQEYFKHCEMGKELSSLEYANRLSKSPLVSLFKSLGSKEIHVALCDAIFINCGEGIGNGEGRPVYHSELNLSANYIPIHKGSVSYRLQKSMRYRRRILASYFKVLADIPVDQRIRPFSEEQSIKHLVRTLVKLETVEMFQEFFYADDLHTNMHYLPLLAERIVIDLWEDCGKIIELALSSNLGNLDLTIEECEKILDGRPQDCANDLGLNKTTVYLDTCTLVLLKYAVMLHGDGITKSSKLKHLAQEVIREESELVSKSSIDESYPSIAPYLNSIFQL
ncbi:HFL229Cp [Eremothecium sinecaudum]|uniref:HFL229Cp n=1 Tax=Eremothecium sinecaudum TaxID=45286 RepID=A0A0X8HUC3_9SACH|nr:HFL229Cp [Eremothecium sinecaudum]AMD21627.1 HFL229Cp [Eremothecium sinecaudum]